MKSGVGEDVACVESSEVGIISVAESSVCAESTTVAEGAGIKSPPCGELALHPANIKAGRISKKAARRIGGNAGLVKCAGRDDPGDQVKRRDGREEVHDHKLIPLHVVLVFVAQVNPRAVNIPRIHRNRVTVAGDV